MDNVTRSKIVSIIDDMDDLTLATVRDGGYPQATTVSYVNDGLTLYFGTTADSQKAHNIASNGKVSLTINRPYANWDEIEGLSISGMAVQVTDSAEQEKVVGLLLKKFPQITEYGPPETSADELVCFRFEPKFISLLDYRQSFGHTELFEL
jgi:Pyridoxamine 5'-phosphate oxidase